jgi:hypothetical protein
VILGAILVASTATTGLAVGGGIGPAAERGAAVAGALAVRFARGLSFTEREQLRTFADRRVR